MFTLLIFIINNFINEMENFYILSKLFLPIQRLQIH